MPTLAEWLTIAFIVGVIFVTHRLRRIGDAVGEVFTGSDAGGTPSAPPDDAAPTEPDAAPTEPDAAPTVPDAKRDADDAS